ncbi:MAG: cation:proton antiporter subunit C [Maricaulis sp.]|uniref:cation:proton antiporter subunit C n=1 Tax=Maricaulis sp. TaxID=1486257 RepID=UPI001B1CE013|nr:cation:proton antiporter subunit C [Maricaulis sp.]MBO6847554.1 cation:proton antiporter subunit C [Maricaulis sp.]MBO6877124.1 cation:proton antiporter subunit C [Maricaulis sp.]
MLDIILERFNYIPIIILMMTGLYVVIATGNLVKRLVGLSLFQTSVFLLYITIGKVFGGQPPILDGAHHGDEEGSHGAGYAAAGHGEAGGDHAAAESHAEPAADAHAGDHAAEAVEHASDYAAGADAAHHASEVLYSNPLPHVLILTAIVVGVATLAVGLALVVRIREVYGTIEDDGLNAADYNRETGGSE